MRYPSLDARLACAAALFPACDFGADIGADHGRLSCYLLAAGKCRAMCVTDISADSLQKARELLSRHGLSDRADFRVGDGLNALDRPVESIAILGMGGYTLSKILTDGKEKLCGASLVLSAQTDLPLVRKTVERIGYHLSEERIVLDAGRFYVILLAKPGNETLTEKQCLLGPRLMEHGGEHKEAYLAWRIGVTAREKTEQAAKELNWLKEEYALVRRRADDRADDRGDSAQRNSGKL